MGVTDRTCPLLMAFSLSLYSLFFPIRLLFSQKGLCSGSEIMHVVLTHKKTKTKIWAPPSGDDFLVRFFK